MIDKDTLLALLLQACEAAEEWAAGYPLQGYPSMADTAAANHVRLLAATAVKLAMDAGVRAGAASGAAALKGE
jgi:hypothetical protein